MGSSGNSSTSSPITGSQRTDIFNYGMGNIQGNLSDNYGNYGEGLNTDYLAYTSPTYQGLANGDYDALENAIYSGQTAKLNTAWNTGLEDINQTASDRGIWSSGVPVKNAQEYYADYIMPTYQQAASNATQQRYNLEASDLQNENTFNLTNASNEYESKWRPLDYLEGLYNTTGGAVSSSTSSGWSL